MIELDPQQVEELRVLLQRALDTGDMTLLVQALALLNTWTLSLHED